MCRQLLLEMTHQKRLKLRGCSPQETESWTAQRSKLECPLYTAHLSVERHRGRRWYGKQEDKKNTTQEWQCEHLKKALLTDMISFMCHSAIVFLPLAISHCPGDRTPGMATWPPRSRVPARTCRTAQKMLKKKFGKGATKDISNIQGVRWKDMGLMSGVHFPDPAAFSSAYISRITRYYLLRKERFLAFWRERETRNLEIWM